MNATVQYSTVTFLDIGRGGVRLQQPKLNHPVPRYGAPLRRKATAVRVQCDLQFASSGVEWERKRTLRPCPDLVPSAKGGSLSEMLAVAVTSC